MNSDKEEKDTNTKEQQEELDQPTESSEAVESDVLDEQEEEFEIDQIRKDKDSAPKQSYMDQYAQTPPKGGSGTKILTAIAVVVVLACAGGIYFLLNSQQNSSQMATSTKEEPAVTETPIPTPTPEPLNRAELSFEVLNGSGVKGEAKRVADLLIELGYKVTKTGNADKDDYAQSELIIGSSLEDKANLIVADLKDIIRIASVSATLKESTPSGRIIIGKE